MQQLDFYYHFIIYCPSGIAAFFLLAAFTIQTDESTQIEVQKQRLLHHLGGTTRPMK